MRYRVHQWIDTKTLEPLYGVQANVEKGKWAHCSSGGKPIMFKEKEKAEETVKLLRKKEKISE